MLPSGTMNSEDTFRQNLLMGCRQHQAILTSHRTGPLRSAGQSSGKDCGSLVPFSGNCNHTQRLALSLAGACGSFLCWEHPSFSQERVSLSQSTLEAGKGHFPGSRQESQKKSKEFPIALSISPRCLVCSRHDKDLDSTHAPHALGKSMFSSMGTGVFTSQGPRI